MAIKRKKKIETKTAASASSAVKTNRVRQWCLGTVLGLLVLAIIGNLISAVLPNPLQYIFSRINSQDSNANSKAEPKNLTAELNPATGQSTRRSSIVNNPIERAECKNPPVTAALNYYPVTYSSPAELCSDYPSIDARIADGGHYSINREEWEAGRTARQGDELYILIWIDNGAADNAEQIVEGGSVARNVRLITETDTLPGAIHYVTIQFGGENTNTVNSRFKIITGENEHLEVIPSSGRIYDYRAEQLLADNLEIGNGTILIGDVKPLFEEGRFVRFNIRIAV